MQEARQMRLADWLLTIDADHVVEDADQIRPTVSRALQRGTDALLVPFTSVPRLWTPRLLRTDLPWRYIGATREYLKCDWPFRQEKVDLPRLRDLADGASRANKWRRDVELLRAELVTDPDNARSWFCLGESYRGLDQHQLAGVAYTNCAVQTKSGEERYWALAMSGEMLFAEGLTEEGLERLLMANQERPQRREALLMACQVLNQLGRHREVVTLLADGAPTRSIPKDDLVAIVPDAYGSAMVREHRIATTALRKSNR
jgi:tetratricopeptide (TPR) repeat protein